MSSEIKANSIQDKTGTRVLASDSGSAWSWGTPPSNTIIQVVSENFESTTTATDTNEVASFLTKDITSSKANAKFLVMVNSMTGGEDATPIVILRRTISSSAFDIETSGGITATSDARLVNVRHGTNLHLSYVDSPSQAASTTINYKIILKSLDTNDVYLGKSGFSAGAGPCLSSITIMELAV